MPQALHYEKWTVKVTLQVFKLGDGIARMTARVIHAMCVPRECMASSVPRTSLSPLYLAAGRKT